MNNTPYLISHLDYIRGANCQFQHIRHVNYCDHARCVSEITWSVTAKPYFLTHPGCEYRHEYN